MENLTEKLNNDEVLTGIKAIEKKLNRSFINLHTLMVAYDFPIKKVDGQYVLNMGEFSDWVEKWGEGLPFDEITSEILYARKIFLKAMSMPKEKRTITGIREIEKFMRKQTCELIDMKRDFDFPMVKTGGILCLSIDALYEWLGKWGFKRPLEVSYSKIESLWLEQQAAKQPDKVLMGDLKTIGEKLGRISAVTLMDYLKYDSCPIKKIPGTNQYEVHMKDWVKFRNMLNRENARHQEYACNVE